MSLATFVPSGAAGTTYTVDVTLAVIGWVAHPESNFGLAFTEAADSVIFASREADPMYGARPRLTVRFRVE